MIVWKVERVQIDETGHLLAMKLNEYEKKGWEIFNVLESHGRFIVIAYGEKEDDKQEKVQGN